MDELEEELANALEEEAALDVMTAEDVAEEIAEDNLAESTDSVDEDVEEAVDEVDDDETSGAEEAHEDMQAARFDAIDGVLATLMEAVDALAVRLDTLTETMPALLVDAGAVPGAPAAAPDTLEDGDNTESLGIQDLVDLENLNLL